MLVGSDCRSTQIPDTLRVLMFRGEDCFIGQCLEYDICTQGPTAEDLRERMECLIQVEIEEALQSGQALDAAPERFHNMWNSSCGAHSLRESVKCW